MANELEKINTNTQVALVDYHLPRMESKVKGGNYSLALLQSPVNTPATKSIIPLKTLLIAST